MKKKRQMWEFRFISKCLFLIKYILLFLVGPPSFVLIIIYRIIVTILIKIQHKDAVFLNSQDAFLAYGKSRDETQLLFSFLCSGSVDIDLFRSKAELGVKQNPRTRSYVKKKYGYYFWLKEKNFNIKDHVLYHPGLSISTKEQWKKVQNDLYYNTSIPEGFSPWFFHCVPLNSDYEESTEKSSFYIVTSFYHCIGDGYSVLHQFLKVITDGESPKLLVPSPTASSVFTEGLNILLFLFLWPYFVMDTLNQKSIFKSSMLSGRQIYCDSGKLKTRTVKNIKKVTKIPFAIILISCIMGALEKFLRRNMISIPEEIIVAIPKVLWNPKDEVVLKNNFIVIYLNLPLNQKHGLGRLKETWDICNSNLARYTYVFDYVIMKWLGKILPTFIGHLLYKNDPSSVTLSIAGLKKYPVSVFEGRSITKNSFKKMMNLFSNVGIVVQTMTCDEDISVSIHSKNTITTVEHLEIVLRDVEKELQEISENLWQWDKYY